MDKKKVTKEILIYVISVIVMLALFWGIAIVASIGQPFYTAPENGEDIVMDFILVAVTFIVLLVYWLIFRKRGFKGVFSFKKCHKSVYIGYAAAIVVDILCVIYSGFFLDGGLKSLVAPSLSTFALSLVAGVYEDAVFRGIPVSFMMKNKPGSLRIYLAVLISAAGFALVHLMNVDMGASLPVTIMQVSSCFVTGLFLAAIYLRTGNVLFIMFYHFFHDLINVMLPTQSTGIMLQTAISATDITVEIVLGIVELAVAIYLLRKVNHDEIKKRWAEIWGE